MLITEKGQVTIPKHLRDAFGFLPGTDVTFEARGAQLLLVRTPGEAGRGRRLTERLLGRGDVPVTTDQIMALTRGD